MNGQEFPSSIPRLANTTDLISTQSQTSDPFYPPGFGLYTNVSSRAGTSTMHPLNPSITNNPLLILIIPTNAGPQSMI